jgi:mono/diheme cytochrome c family protein
MSKSFKLMAAACSMIGTTIAPCLAADPLSGKDIAKRWCASCHLIESGQTSATDQASPFTYLAKTPDFDRNRLAFLLLMPHPNMPNMSLNRAEISDLADYIRSLK